MIPCVFWIGWKSFAYNWPNNVVNEDGKFLLVNKQLLNRCLLSKLLLNKQITLKWFCLFALLCSTVLPVTQVFAATDISLSPNMQAVLLSKILLHERRYRSRQNIKVFVLGDQSIALAFKQLIGKSSEHIQIAHVALGDVLPEQKYDVVYFNDKKYLADVVAYGKKNSIISVTGIPRLVEKGATLGTGTDKGRPRFYLNLRTSFATDLEWDQKVLNIVKVYR